MFAYELLDFHKTTEIFSKSKAITSPNATSIFDLLLNHFNTSIATLLNPSQGAMETLISIEQSRTLKGAYTTMKAKLVKYELQVKRKLIFPITIFLEPSLKLEHIPIDVQEYITKNFKHVLYLMHVPLTLSSCSQSEPLLSTSSTCSKI